MNWGPLRRLQLTGPLCLPTIRICCSVGVLIGSTSSCQTHPSVPNRSQTKLVGGEAGRRGRASANFGPEVWLQPLIRSTTTPPSLFSRVKLQSVPKVLRRLSSGELPHCASPLIIIHGFEHKFKFLFEDSVRSVPEQNPR